MNLIWADFSERPCLDTYRTLEGHARKAGDWPGWRDRALAEIRAGISKARNSGQTRDRWMLRDLDHSRLVDILLYERDPEAAWREAQEGGCSQELWRRLAEAREEEHPADAAPIYLRQAEEFVITSRYKESVDLLVKAAALMKRMDRSGDFVRHLDALRLKHSRKRNFMKQLEEKRKVLYAS
jgi:hypothetical protein